jgi:hypothetical protein
VQRAPDEVALGAHVEASVVPHRLHPVDVLHLDEQGAVALGDGQPLEVARPGGSGHSRRRQHAAAELGELRAGHSLLGALHRLQEALRRERLEQVVESLLLEGSHGVLVVGGDEDDRRQPARRQPPQGLEAVDLGHLDVEHQDVGLEPPHRLDHLGAVGALRHHFNLRVRGESVAQRATGEGLVVGKHQAEDARRGIGPHAPSPSASRHGIDSEARAPPRPAPSSSSRQPVP